MSRCRLLVIDDGLDYARLVVTHLPEFALVPAGDPPDAPRIPDGPAALAFLQNHVDEVDLVLLDVHFDLPEERLLPVAPGASLRRTRRFQGVAILRELRRRWPDLPVVLMTSVADLSLLDIGEELASQSMTYLLDSDDLQSLRIRLNAAAAESQAVMEERGILWGRDPAMRSLRRRLAVLARGRTPIIIEGETGTGKSFLANRFVHVRSGRPGPFVTLDLATVPADLVAAHLFGAVRGAFTGAVSDRKGLFELADRGTLLIDEIQNVPLEAQKQLLLVLQDRRVRPLGATREIEVDVKVVAASNSSLAEAVAQGRFRRDLYMRLSPATRVCVPPLRERPAELEWLLHRFVEGAAAEPGNSELRQELCAALSLPPTTPVKLAGGGAEAGEGLVMALPPAAWEALRNHAWPGNLRELSMVAENLVTFTLVAATEALRAGIPLVSPRLQIDTGLLHSLLAGYAELAAPTLTPVAPEEGTIPVLVRPAESLNAVANEVERQYLIALFRRTGGDFPAMAELLLGDREKGRAVRLRFNQLGLKVRTLR